MSEIQLANYQRWKARFEGNNQESTKYAEKLQKMDPTNRGKNQNLAFAQLVNNNDPRLAIATIEAFDDSFVDYKNCSSCKWLYRWLADAHYRLGNYTKVLSVVDSLDFEISDPFLAALDVKSAIRLDSFELMERKLQTYAKNSFDFLGYQHVLVLVISEFRVLGREELLEQFAKELLSWCEKNEDHVDMDAYRAYSLAMLKEWKKFIPYSIQFLEDPNLEFRYDFTRMLSLAYFQTDQRNELAQLEKDLLERDRSQTYGEIPYTLAVLEVARGNHEKAVELLEEAIQEGKRFRSYNFQFDPLLKPLLELPAFQDLLKFKS